GFLHAAAVAALLAACVTAGRGHLIGLMRRKALLLVPALVVTVPLWLPAFFRPWQFDATLYHLSVAKVYAQTHTVAPVLAARFPVFPQLEEMLFAAGLLLSGPIAAQLVQTLSLGLVAVVLFVWGRRAFSRRAGLWAAALFLGVPLAVWLGTSAYIDVGLT